MAMHGVDASGFVDASFWNTKGVAELGEEPTLRAVAMVAVAWLEGTHLASPERELERGKWLAARKHTLDKVAVVQQYRAQCACTALLAGTLLPEWIAPAFHPLLGFGQGTLVASRLPISDQWLELVREISPGIYAFDLFTPEFCSLLVTEVDSFEATELPRRRPNTMNRLGLVVNEIGLEPLMSQLVERLVAPLCAALYPNEMDGDQQYGQSNLTTLRINCFGVSPSPVCSAMSLA
jgi:hypothetical protein